MARAWAPVARSVALLLLVLLPAAQRVDILDGLIASVEDVVDELAEQASEAFKRRFPAVIDCKCSRHACDGKFDKSDTCHEELGDSDLCGECAGQKLDFNNSYVLTPPGTDLTNLSLDVKDAVCTYKVMDGVFQDVKDDLGIRAWSYIGTTSGVMRSWPGHAMDRGDNVTEGLQEEQLGNCQLYDPRIRPWYVAATSGPKDVALVIDTSGSMNTIEKGANGFGFATRWVVARDAILKLLETFGFTDYVNLVEFNDAVKTIIPGTMVQATEENLEQLKTELRNVRPTGATDFRLGLEAAFDLLIEAAKRSLDDEELVSSDCQKVILFMTDGEDCTLTGKNCSMEIPANTTAVDAVLEFIETKQQELEAAGSQRAHIFSFSFGSEADDEIPKEMACLNEGVWHRILAGEDPLLDMNAYTSYLASDRGGADVIWSRVYDDAFGLGKVVTAARPVYSPDTSVGEPGGLVGVVGHDVRLEDFEAASPNFLDTVRRFISRGIQCINVEFSGCQLQLLRGEEAQCPETFEEAECYFFERTGDYYTAPKLPLLDFDGAVAYCEERGGDLAEVDEPLEEEFLSGLASNAGSWVGLTRNNASGEWVWKNSGVEQPPDSEAWTFLKNLTDPEKACATIDRRGVNMNIHPESCATKTRVLCEFTGPDLPDECSGGEIIRVDSDYEYTVRPLSTCRPEEEALRDATVTSPGAEPLKNEDVICPITLNNATTFDIRCCDECEA